MTTDEKESIIIKFNLDKVRKIKNNIKVGVAKIYMGQILIYEENIYITKTSKKFKLKDFFK